MTNWGFQIPGFLAPEQQQARRQGRADKRARAAHKEDMRDVSDMQDGLLVSYQRYGPHPWRKAGCVALGLASAGLIGGLGFLEYQESHQQAAGERQAVEQVLTSSRYLGSLGLCAAELRSEAGWQNDAGSDAYRRAASLADAAQLPCRRLDELTFVNVALPGGDLVEVRQRDVIPYVYASGG